MRVLVSALATYVVAYFTLDIAAQSPAGQRFFGLFFATVGFAFSGGLAASHARRDSRNRAVFASRAFRSASVTSWT
jgi:hypothetical protein